MYILGISALYHDSAAVLIKNGDIICAVQEERFSRKKGDSSFPIESIKACLNHANIGINNVEHIVFYEDSYRKFNRILTNYFLMAPRGIIPFLKSVNAFLTYKLKIPVIIRKRLNFKNNIYSIEHHLSHASSAFYPSPYSEAAILTIDGVGEWATCTIGKGYENKIELIKEIQFPHSLGMLYSAFTYYAGFKVNSGEYKLMGLAPYGKPEYVGTIYEKIIHVNNDGSFQLNMKYFDYCTGLKMINNRFCSLFGGKPRKPESPVTQKEMNIAKSIQVVAEQVIHKLAITAKKMTGSENLCLAGGVSLNCVANGKLLRENIFENIWIQPAAGDAGGALGCALNLWYSEFGNLRRSNNGQDYQKGSYLGPCCSNEEIMTYLDQNNYPYEYYEKDSLATLIAELLDAQKVIGIFQGRMEYGPRALGNRSIIGDPRSPKMQNIMNLKIKYRESFRPFAPSVLEEKAQTLFKFPDGKTSPYMLFVAEVKDEIRKYLAEEEKSLWGIEKLKIKRSEIPAVTHVDYSARLQTVNKNTNPFYYSIISEFEKITGYPVVINTSFNVRGEPIVCSYQDAYRCFMRTEMDYLILENCILNRKSQPPFCSDINWREQIPLD